MASVGNHPDGEGLISRFRSFVGRNCYHTGVGTNLTSACECLPLCDLDGDSGGAGSAGKTD